MVSTHQQLLSAVWGPGTHSNTVYENMFDGVGFLTADPSLLIKSYLVMPAEYAIKTTFYTMNK